MRSLFAAILCLGLVPSLVHADEAEKEKKPKKEKKEKKDKGELEFGGRVFARGAMTKVDESPYLGQGSIASARVGASYRYEDLRADIEFELTSRKLKDAFLRLRLLDSDAKIDVRAGQFKMPFSAIQLESAWKLPVAERGLLNNVMNDRLQISGRHVGVEVEAKLGGAMKPKLVAGIFQGTNDLGDPLAATVSDGLGQDVVLRGSIQPVDGFEIGAAGGVRSGGLQGIPFKVRHRWSAELDATLDVAAGPGRARLWAEGMAGSSWLVSPPSQGGVAGHTKAIFTGGRVLAAWRFRGADKGDCFIEPYAMFGVIDPDRSYQDDLVIEATGGIGYGSWDVWRLQAEVEVWRVGDNAPVGIEVNGAYPADSTNVLLQAGAHF